MTINTLKKLPQLLTFAFPLLLLVACGGGGGGGGGNAGDSGGTPVPQAQQVTATFALQNAPAVVGSVQIEVILPDSFVLSTDAAGQPTAGTLTVLVNGATAAVNYIPQSAAANGAVTAAIIKADGFPGTAPLLQLSQTYAAGVPLPVETDFIVNVAASDLNGTTLSNIGKVITISAQPLP